MQRARIADSIRKLIIYPEMNVKIIVFSKSHSAYSWNSKTRISRSEAATEMK